jgi:hypothetical protein
MLNVTINCNMLRVLTLIPTKEERVQVGNGLLKVARVKGSLEAKDKGREHGGRVQRLQLLLPLDPGACTIKHFTAVISDFRNKLECLSLASFSSQVPHPGKLRPYPQTLDLAGEACQGQTL